MSLTVALEVAVYAFTVACVCLAVVGVGYIAFEIMTAVQRISRRNR